MIDEGQRTTGARASRRRLLTGAGVVAGLGLAGGAGLAGGLAAGGRRPPAAAPAPAVDIKVVSAQLLKPSGDRSGVTDYRAIQTILNPTSDGNGENTAVVLDSGVFYVNQTITFKASQQAIRGQGQNITTIAAADGFTAVTQTGPPSATPFESAAETAVIYTGGNNQFLIVDGLTIQGPAAASRNSLALGDRDQLNGLQQTGGSIRCQFTNLHFRAINGWPVIFDGRGGNNAGTLLENVLADGCPVICYFQGDLASGAYRGSATMMNVTAVNMVPSSGVMAGVPAAFVIRDYEDLLAWSATPGLIEGACASCFFYAIDTGSTILLADGPANGVSSPGDIGFYGGIVEAGSGNQSGIRITGGAHQITIDDLKIAYNANNGVSVEGGGDQILIRDCQFQDNGAAGSKDGTAYYDLNWTGSASGQVRGCAFNTPVAPAGTPGVAASVNFKPAAGGAADAQVSFADCQFPQSGATGPMFNELPSTSTVRDCTPYNPVGDIAVSVPASGDSTAPLSHDAAFYVTAGPVASCAATVNGSTITIPAGAVVPVLVPAGSRLTLSYGTAPTWTVNAN